MNNKYSQFLTIFEGCDGAGKTTLAKAYAAEQGARYVHFGDLKHINDGLARIYVEGMLPAVLGHEHVVFDRSWLSEIPYGEAYREGKLRMIAADFSMVERLAMRCSAVVVRCNPGWNTTKQNWLKRKSQEMIKDPAQLKQVWGLYMQMSTDLPLVNYDYREGVSGDALGGIYNSIAVQRKGLSQHPLDFATAGNWDAKYVIVGEKFADLKEQDPFYQWPFASFSNVGCSRWLTEELILAGISERNILWINADQDLGAFFMMNPGKTVIGLGEVACSELNTLGIHHYQVPHPQYHKRFYNGTRYHLISFLKGAEK